MSTVNLYCWQTFKNEINNAQKQYCLLWMHACAGLYYSHCMIPWDYWNFDQCPYLVTQQQDCVETSTLVPYPDKFLVNCVPELLSTVSRLLATKRLSLQAMWLQDFLLMLPDLARTSHFAKWSALFKNLLPGNTMVTKRYDDLLGAGGWTRHHLPVPSGWCFPVILKPCFGLRHGYLLLPAG